VYHADSIDVFAAGCFLFELVMKCEPFQSADIKDEHYGKLAALDKKKFWDTFSSKFTPPSTSKVTHAAFRPHLTHARRKPQRTDHALCPLKARWVNGEGRASRTTRGR